MISISVVLRLYVLWGIELRISSYSFSISNKLHIFSTKNPRKKEDKFEIEKEGYYILFEVKNNVLYVINAKKT